MAWTLDEQRRWEAVEALLREKPEVFAVQGWIQSSGGVNRLCYREGRAVQSLSLGRSQRLADCVAELLQKMQWAERSRLYMKSLCHEASKGKRLALAAIDDLLDRCGERRVSPDADELDANPPDDEPPDSFQRLRQFIQSHPTGGKGCPRNAVFR